MIVSSVSQPADSRRVRLVLRALACGLAAFYLLTMSGHIYASDEETLYYISEGLVEGRGLTVSPLVALVNRVPGRDGQLYSQYPVGQSVAAVPLYLAGKAVAAFAPPEARVFVTRLYVLTFNCWITVLLCVLMARTALLFGTGLRTATALALLLGLTTLHWVYARTFFAEPLTALLTLLSLYGIASYRKIQSRGGCSSPA